MTSGVGAGASDPFALTADPAAYCPRAAHEAALFALGERLAETPACAALVGEAGLGKTLLLHVLADRCQGASECVYVPFPRLEPAGLWRWVAAGLHAGGTAGDRAAVLAHARRRREEGRRLMLLVDDAGALPPETLRDLIAACLCDIGLVLALTPADVARMGGLPAPIHRVDVGPPMTLAETHAYVNARLRRADPSGGMAERLDAQRVAELQRAAGGVPARLHVLLDAWLRGAAPEAALEARRPEPAPLTEPDREPAAAALAPPARHRVRPAAQARERRTLLRGLQRRRSVLPLVLLVLLAIGGVWRFALPPESWRQLAGAPEERMRAARSEPPPAAAPPPGPAAPAQTEIFEPEAALAATPQAAAAAGLAAASPAEPPPQGPSAEAREPAPAEPPALESAAAAPPVVAAEPVPERMPDVAAAPASPEPPPTVVTLVAPLAPPPAGPRLSVNAQPWAEIQLDGRPVGETPIGELPIAPGPHRLRAILPGGRVIERSIEAQAGDLYVVFP
jgi:type II secretory pathway predicted ATPase ExeA